MHPERVRQARAATMVISFSCLASLSVSELLRAVFKQLLNQLESVAASRTH